MPSYKLIYFNARGRGEMTRLMFAAAGVKYEDCRLTKEEFLKLQEGIIILMMMHSSYWPCFTIDKC